jgi:hypothetical protein
MAKFNTKLELLQYIAQLRRDHAGIRAEVAARMALGLSYANGRQWTTLEGGSSTFSELIVDAWEEDWDPRSSELRVVDNRIGPLYRRIAADTNATRIESQVQPPLHMRGFEAVDQAKVSQWILNALSDDVGMTRVARNASSLRWVTGSALINVTLSKKKRVVPADVARMPDGSPVSINDQWVRWELAPLSDLIWDPTNVSSDLEDHHTLVLERVYTLKQFELQYGKIEGYGIKKENLPRLEELAPHHIAATAFSGTAFFSAYARNREAPGIRVVTLMEGDPRDPTRWPLRFVILDPSPENDYERQSGVPINFDNPQSPFGHHQRPLFKLDAFRRDDAVLPHGAPHVMMGDQDRLNLLESTQFQQLLNVVHGYWLTDTRSVNREEFVGDLSNAVGGILRWDSHGGELAPPQFVTPPPPRQEFVTIGASVALAMREQVHISAMNLGQGKTHINKDFQQRLLQESNTVLDNIITRDVDAYSDALKLTLGTVRLAMNGPNRMIARLRDRHGLSSDDLGAFLNVDPYNSPLEVRVRTHSVVSRSIMERQQQLLMAAQMGIVSPKETWMAFAEELERPITKSHDLQLQFCHNAVRQIVAGADWPGMPNLDWEVFAHTAQNAMWGLDPMQPEDRAAIARLETGILVQKQLHMENNIPQEMLDKQGAGGIESPNGAQTSGSQGGGAPGSINPATSPVGAAGGLPLGLPPAV